MTGGLLVIGKERKGLKASQYQDRINLYEHGTVILELGAMGFPSALDAHQSTQFRSSVEAKWNALLEWTSAGHSLILIVNDLPVVQMRLMSGGQASFRFLELPHLCDATFERATGSLVRWCPANPAPDALSKFIPRMSYIALISSTIFTPLFEVNTARPGPQQLVGVTKSLGMGTLSLVPEVRAADTDPTTIAAYYAALCDLQSALEPHIAAPLPEWTRQYVTEAEKTAIAVVNEKSSLLSMLNEEIQAQQALIEKEQDLKQLFAGTGEEYEEAVHSALEELGFIVARVAGNRADRLALHGSTIIAIEAKGIEKGGKEEYLRQTDRWVSDTRAALVADNETLKDHPDLKGYVEALDALASTLRSAPHEKTVKGMLILGTYRKVPLSGRIEEDYPNNVGKACARSSVCALTGLQLFALVMKARGDPNSKEAIRQLLVETDGVLSFGCSGYLFANGSKV